VFEAVLLPAIAERTVTSAEVEAAGGLSIEETAAFIGAFGLPSPDAETPWLTPQEATVLTEIGRTQDIWPLDVRVRVARVMGRHLHRIAQAQVQQFLTHFEPELHSVAPQKLESLRAVQAVFARLLPLSEHILVGAHRRWLEHELGQAAVGQAEAAHAGVRLPGAVDITVAFCDLKDFTAYADLAGDAAAIEAIERLTELVMQERSTELRLMKSLGDGFMLCFSDVREAVAVAERLVAGMRDHDGPGLHASVHRGIAVARDGDYFGSAVNLAARLLAAADKHQIIATRAVADETGRHFSWHAAGVLRIRGFAEPVEAFRLAS
jgi:adenylate cyclase